MIDTIRFRIPLDKRQYEALRRRSVEYNSTDHKSDRILFQFFRLSENLGSFNRSIALTIGTDEECYLELSLPKYLMGHNLMLIDCDKIDEYLDMLHKDICQKMSPIPEPFFWEYQRIDFCYTWRFLDDAAVQTVLQHIQGLEYGRKDRLTYSSSVMFKGSHTTIKFYQKSAEFFEHDFKIVKKLDNQRAFELLNFSRGLFRFEITMRKRGLVQEFHLNRQHPLVLTSELCNSNIYKILNKYLNKIMDNSTIDGNNNSEVYDVIRAHTKTASNANDLYMFSRLFYSPDPIDKKAISLMNRKTRWRYQSKLKKLKIGFVAPIVGSIPLIIPSPYCVNQVGRPL